MNKFFRIIILTILCTTFIMGKGLIVAQAAVNNIVETDDVLESDRQPRVYWSGTAFVSETAYTNITSSNNLFSDYPKVTNHAGNGGVLSFRIVNEDGETIVSAKDCSVGYSITMGKIPFNSGTYTLQAKAQSGKEGQYYITID